LKFREVNAGIQVPLLQLIQFILDVLDAIEVFKGIFQVSEHLGVIQEIRDSITDLQQDQFVSLSSQAFSNINQTGNSDRESIGVGFYFTVDLLRETPKIAPKTIEFLWINNLLTEIGTFKMDGRSQRFRSRCRISRLFNLETRDIDRSGSGGLYNGCGGI
jgi:hypothetical protein